MQAAINAIMLEADLLSSLDHKNIVKNLEVDQTEDYIFFVMELISRCERKRKRVLCHCELTPDQTTAALCTRRCKSSGL